MDKHSKAIYKRGAMFVVPIALIVGCRVGFRACVALSASDRRSAVDDEIRREQEARQAAELAQAMATSEAAQRARARTIPTATKGSVLAPIASAQQVPDALAVDADNVAWLSTRSGEVVIAPRAGGAPRVLAGSQKLPQRRHVQGLALAGGWVYWINSTPQMGDDEEDGALLRIKADAAPGTEPEVLLSELGGINAIAVDKDSVYFARSRRVSRDEDGGATGGVWRLRLDKKGAPIKGGDAPAAKNPKLLVAAERPCGIAVDDAAVYTVEQLQIWRAPKNGGEANVLAKGSDRLGCGIAVDESSVYWTIPSDDSLMKAKKADGSEIGVAAFVRKRPTNVVVDRGYAYVLAETSPQALGELGSVFRVALRSDQAVPAPLVTDQIGLQSVAAHDGFVAFAAYNEAESDGVVMSIAKDAQAVDALDAGKR